MLKILCPVLLLICSLQNTFAQSSYQFDGRQIKPGTKQHFTIPIVSGKDTTIIPVTVFNGLKKGKTLGITAGVHGYEYAPILAAQKLISSIDPKNLSGVIILVQIANMESFRGRSPYISPADRKNLNRVFPGSANGTITERVADYITKNIIVKSDYFLDTHSGDAPEDLTAYGAHYSNSSMPAISKTGKEMAVSMGFDYVVTFDTDGKNYMNKNEPALYCTAEAFKRGIPAADIECGRLGMVEEAPVKKVESSVLNMLKHLKFMPDEHAEVQQQAPVMIKGRMYYSSKQTGIFYALKKAGEHVKKGMQLGYTTNYFGETVEKFYAQEDGLILLIIGTPAINKDEDVVVLGTL